MDAFCIKGLTHYLSCVVTIFFLVCNLSSFTFIYIVTFCQIEILIDLSCFSSRVKFTSGFFFLRWSRTLLPRLQYSGMISAHCSLYRLGSSNPPASASWVAGTTGTGHHTLLIFVFLVETGFHLVDQNGLDILTSWTTCLGLPKCWDYRRESQRPAQEKYFKSYNGRKNEHN